MSITSPKNNDLSDLECFVMKIFALERRCLVYTGRDSLVTLPLAADA
jgi:hypothetical protein